MATKKKEEKKTVKKTRAKKLEKNQWHEATIIGELDNTMAGGVPQEIDKLIHVPDKPERDQINMVKKEKVKLLCQAGRPDEALEYIQETQKLEESYNAVLNTFRRDKVTGAPYIGAHMLQSAFFDAAVASFKKELKIYDQKGDTSGASKMHLRKQVNIRPFHIFMHRPDMGNGFIKDVDDVEWQQPTTGARGFARHEVIHAPFQFMFKAYIDYRPPFTELKNRDLVEEIFHRAAWHGIGSKRNMGYGAWHIVSIDWRAAASR